MRPLRAVDPTAIESFRHLCELIHRPTPRALAKGTTVDWSPFPTIAAITASNGNSTPPEAVGAGVRALLERAVAALRTQYPDTPGRLSPIDVVECHLIRGYSWEAITTECLERGAPVSERTLRMRQREGLERVLTWVLEEGARAEREARAERAAREAREARETSARSSAAPATAASTVATPQPATLPTRSNARAWIRRAVLATVLVTSGAWLAVAMVGPPDGVHAEVDLSTLPLGQPIHMADGFGTLPEPYPRWRLPSIGSQFERATLVEPAPGEIRVLLAAAISGGSPGEVVLYDPQREEIVWRDRLRPAAAEIGRSPNFDPRATLESFRPTHFVYGTRATNLGASVMVVFTQRHSPCFVVEYDLETGARRGQYYHVGRLETWMVVDLDRDARPEVLLGGQDDELEVPVLVMLRPGLVRGAASTAPGVHGGDAEGACMRVLLPAIAELQDHWETNRLQVVDRVSHRWDADNGVLSFQVGPNNEEYAYRVRLNRALQPIPGATISVGGKPARAWRAAGLDPSRAEDLAAEIRVVRGGACAGESR